MEPPPLVDETSVLIMGHRVAFPAGKSPFPAQLAVMSSTLSALKRKQHALVESPTGSGKTLALLSSCLTFQRDYMQESMANYYQKKQQQQQQQPRSSGDINQVIGQDSRWNDDVIDLQQQAQQLRAQLRTLQQQQQLLRQRENQSQFSQTSGGDDVFGLQQAQQLRAHLRAQQVQQQQLSQTESSSQFSQASGWDDNAFGLLQRSVKRFKREDGSTPVVDISNTQQRNLMGLETQMEETQALDHESEQETRQEIKDEEVFGPDDFQTVQPPTVNDEPILVNEKCQELRMEKERRRMAGDDEEEGGCKYNQTSFSRLRAQAPQVWDIEDISKLASTCEECAYFFSKSELETAHVVFCPYNYVLDPAIRKAVGITLHNSIVVLDEAHNVEDTCREGASLEITDRMLASAIKSFDDVIWHEDSNYSPPAYDTVRQMLSCVESWFTTNEELVREPEDIDDDDCHVLWSTEDALTMLRDCKLMEVTGADIEEIAQHEQMKLATPGKKVLLNNRALNTATRLISVATYMFSNNSKNADDFKLLITKKMRLNDEGEEVIDTKLCIWCLSAAVVFSEVARESHSVILASGTLSPMDSFAGELGVDFPIRLEANHVVNMRKQVFIGALMSGPGGVDLLSTYKNQQNFQYQDSIGLLLLQYAQVIPGGILMFFPSYALMGILKSRWKRTGVWNKLEKHKKMFSEPRQGGKEFDDLLDKYKITISRHAAAHEAPSGWISGDAEPRESGAIFLAVYRGKVSEGIDFSDDNARAVLAVGIPFPNFKDLKVSLKREYQDSKSRDDRRLVNGSLWYKLQAFRALNQALGRCIRHRRDYGAVILIDSRHRNNIHGNSLSKWMRPHVQEFRSSEDCNSLFTDFFQRNQVEMPVVMPAPEPEPAPTLSAPTPVRSGPIILEYEEDISIKAECQTVP
ncbi:DEAD2 domain containing hypothetical protein [Phytophthora palmivora]|uniref:Helicase ATP-binding domain-containing protein n=1 Tax=Phytophthora palmivora TaxID=4796 RepID=A0A2P4X5E5_9STRA|nr:DEAD2 domain containing hypothetical protein [Phytophthora palmivora]